MNRNHGFALLEVMFALVCLAGTTVVVVRTMNASTKSAAVSSLRHDLTAGVERNLESIRADFEYGAISTLATEVDDAPVPIVDGVTYSNIQCSAVTNVTDAGVEYGPPISYGFELAPRELPDGKDNDGDGIIDNGMLVRTDDRGRQVMRTGVTRLDFVKNADEVSCTITLARSRPGGAVMTRTERIVFKIVNN
jgi:type II secretory pathway pseudopilin PulG